MAKVRHRRPWRGHPPPQPRGTKPFPHHVPPGGLRGRKGRSPLPPGRAPGTAESGEPSSARPSAPHLRRDPDRAPVPPIPLPPQHLLKQRLMRPAPRRQRKQLSHPTPPPPPCVPSVSLLLRPLWKEKGVRQEAKVKRERRRAVLTTYNWNRKGGSSVSALRAQTKWRRREQRGCFPLLPRSRGVCAP